MSGNNSRYVEPHTVCSWGGDVEAERRLHEHQAAQLERHIFEETTSELRRQERRPILASDDRGGCIVPDLSDGERAQLIAQEVW
jgi:hypothetical protein